MPDSFDLGPFGTEAPNYLRLGIPVIPVGGDDGKRPLIKTWQKTSVKRSIALLETGKFDHANNAFKCGRHSGITVVDIDSPDEAILREAEIIFGSSPVIVRSASGGIHIYFSWSGEKRKTRVIPDLPIDLIGDGLCTLPPSSREGRGQYTFIKGGPDNLLNLPKIQFAYRITQHESLSERINTPQVQRLVANHRQIQQSHRSFSGRNDRLFRAGLPIAQEASDKASLEHDLADINRGSPAPLSDNEVAKIAESLWKYRERGNLLVPGQRQVVISDQDIQRLNGDGDATLLLCYLRLHHGVRSGDFALAVRAMHLQNVIPGWSERRIRKARDALLTLGYLIRTSGGGRYQGDCAMFAWKAAATCEA